MFVAPAGLALRALRASWRPLACMGDPPARRFSAAEITRDAKCLPCEGIGSALPVEQAAALVAEKAPAWSMGGDQGAPRIFRTWKRASFIDAMQFLNRVAEVAEAEGHHPDLHLTQWNRVRIEFWTHALGGITENDIIMAMKVDAVDAQPKA
ncbi:hypothetical protein CDCA_CDCA15G3998 [Cyanidium caldarium]|uniref:4a-hydroxytetrahydrobiopterin dehydratase n=1 Tax=Cyanidium caldarium TaxID=2771 RepID=A0AAV9J061_CYACA|nr:hypothetical protein CDCA_CDCA15G3998 [Cyanidium caldarium]